MEKPTLILDTRESNKYLIDYTEINDWEREVLKLSKYIYLEDPETGYKYPDWDCGDITNSNIDGIIELKSFGDAVNSLSGGGVTKKAVYNEQEGKWAWTWMVNEGRYHLQNQVIKMEATGLPYMVIIYGERYIYQKKSGVSDELIIQAMRKLTRLQGKFRFGLMFCKEEMEAMMHAETFLIDAEAMPRRYVNYNLFKGIEDEPVNALCGFTGFGPEIARTIISKYNLGLIGYDVTKMSKGDFIKKYATNRDTKVFGLGKVTAGKLYDNFCYAGSQPDPVKGVDY